MEPLWYSLSKKKKKKNQALWITSYCTLEIFKAHNTYFTCFTYDTYQSVGSKTTADVQYFFFFGLTNEMCCAIFSSSLRYCNSTRHVHPHTYTNVGLQQKDIKRWLNMNMIVFQVQTCCNFFLQHLHSPVVSFFLCSTSVCSVDFWGCTEQRVNVLMCKLSPIHANSALYWESYYWTVLLHCNYHYIMH